MRETESFGFRLAIDTKDEEERDDVDEQHEAHLKRAAKRQVLGDLFKQVEREVSARWPVAEGLKFVNSQAHQEKWEQDREMIKRQSKKRLYGVQKRAELVKTKLSRVRRS